MSEEFKVYSFESSRAFDLSKESDLAAYRLELEATRLNYDLLADSNLEQAEKELAAGKFDEVIFILRNYNSAAFVDGSVLHARHAKVVRELTQRLCESGRVGVAHSFYRRIIAFSEKCIAEAKNPHSVAGAEILSYPYLIDWYRRYMHFCKEMKQPEHLKQAELGYARALKKDWPKPIVYPKDKRPMSEEVFWDLIKEAKLASAEGASDIGEDLVARLVSRKQSDILLWDKLLYEKVLTLYTDKTWELGHKATGFMSDDGILYFCGWIVGEGKEFYKSFLKDPEAALSAVSSGSSLQSEEILLVANLVFEAKEWNEEKLEKLRPKLPELQAKFASLE
jgi:hypothetical protein